MDNLAANAAGVTVSQGATGVGSSSKITIRVKLHLPITIRSLWWMERHINNSTLFNFTNEAAAGFQEVDFGNGGMGD